MFVSLDSRTVSNPSSTTVGTRTGSCNLLGTFPYPPIPLPGEYSTPPGARNARLRPRVVAPRILPDLAQRLLLDLSEQDETVKELVVQQGKKWRLRATKITNELNERPGSPWNGRIKAPNSSGRSEAVATETTMATSLQPVLNGSFVGKYEDDKVILLLQRLWTAIGELMPEAVAEPGNYVLQKTPWIYTVHILSPRIFEACRDKGNLSVEGIKEVLTATEEARGYFVNEEFWRGRAIGGVEAATYNGMGAFRQLADDIERTLPELQLDLSI